MDILKNIQEYFSYGDSENDRITKLNLDAKDINTLDKILLQDSQLKKTGKDFWLNSLFFSRILFSYGFIILVIKIIFHINNFSTEKTLLFCGLLSIIMCTGPGVLLKKEHIEKLDKVLYHLFYSFEAFTIYSIKHSLSFSKKSSHYIQYRYIIYPYLLIAFTSLASLSFSELFFAADGLVNSFLSTIFTYPLIYFETYSPWLKYQGIAILIFMSITYAPTFVVEKMFHERQEYKKWSKRISIYNLVVSIFHISALLFSIGYQMKKQIPDDYISLLFSFKTFTILGPIIFIYIQLGTVIYLHQQITIKYMNKEKAIIPYFFLITDLSQVKN